MNTLSVEERAKIQEAIDQTNAIFALEGFQPTEQSRKIDAAVLAGRVSSSQVVEEMRSYVMTHKTIEGFVESRTWSQAC
ncbi:MAG: antitoxin VbhA family protein [Burkholderiales bacterium]|jgi:hypothetical protein|nr:antitoxin VbhA family protein [Burkholderiales bacterium]